MHGIWDGNFALRGDDMWNRGRLSTYWRTELYFLLAGAIFVACQFVVASGRPDLGEASTVQTARTGQPGDPRTGVIEDNR